MRRQSAIAREPLLASQQTEMRFLSCNHERENRLSGRSGTGNPFRPISQTEELHACCWAQRLAELRYVGLTFPEQIDSGAGVVGHFEKFEERSLKVLGWP